jgi:glycosyltransferase involved in cell wall biosynthesis
MSKSSTFSVVIPCTRAQFIDRAVNSVTSQTRAADEIILVYQGRGPIPRNLLGHRATVLHDKTGRGASSARNVGASAASGDYLSFLDDDDYWESDYLSQVEQRIMASPRTPDLVVAAKWLLKDSSGEPRPYKVLTSTEGLLDRLLVSNPGVGGQNITVRTAFFQKFGGFRESLLAGNDRALGVDVIINGGEIVLADKAVAVKINHQAGQITSKPRPLSRLRFLLIFWTVMSPAQRQKNVENLVRGVLARIRDFRRG